MYGCMVWVVVVVVMGPIGSPLMYLNSCGLVGLKAGSIWVALLWGSGRLLRMEMKWMVGL